MPAQWDNKVPASCMLAASMKQQQQRIPETQYNLWISLGVGLHTYGRCIQAGASQTQSIQKVGQHSRPSSKHQLPGSFRVGSNAGEHPCGWGHVPNHPTGNALGCCLQRLAIMYQSCMHIQAANAVSYHLQAIG